MEQESINGYGQYGITQLPENEYFNLQENGDPYTSILQSLKNFKTQEKNTLEVTTRYIDNYEFNENYEVEEADTSSLALGGLAKAVQAKRMINRLESSRELKLYNVTQFTKYDENRTNSIKENEIYINYRSPLSQKIQARKPEDYLPTGLESFSGFVVDKPKAKRSVRERAAHKFRSSRMRSEPFEDLMDGLQSRPDAKKSVSRMVRRAKDLMTGTQSELELHRAYAPLIAGLLTESETRSDFVSALDISAAADSESLKTEALVDGTLETDVLIIGAGVQGAIFSAELRSASPDIRIVAVDKAKKLGGQFGKYGARPVFFINSRNFRPQDNKTVGLPGKNGNLNSFGAKAPIQLTDFSSETYPTNVELRTATAVNQYLSAETMLGVDVDLDDGIKKLADGRYEVTSTDAETGEAYTIITKKIVVATGPGERQQPNRQDSGRWTADELLTHFADESNPFPMDAFAGKTIAIKGGGDTGRVIAELLTRLGPKEAYGKSTVQFGGPKKILWYGTDFDNREEFCDTNRPRYERLASFIVKSRQDVPQDSQIVPFRSKITSDTDFRGRIIIQAGAGVETADIVIDATQLASNVLGAFRNIPGEPEVIEEPIQQLGNINAAIGRRLDDGIYFVGPVANLPLTETERQSFAKGIKENTIAIWKNQLRSTQMARTVARDLAPISTRQKVLVPA